MTRQTTRSSIDAARAARLMPAVTRIARGLRRRLPRTVEIDDLVGAGALGLAAAIRAHAEADEATFERNAVCRIRGAMFDMLRQNDVLTRCQRARVRDAEREVEQADAATDAATSDAAAEQRRDETLRLRAAAQRHQALDLVSHKIHDDALSAEEQLVQQQRLRKVHRAVAELSPRLAKVLDLSIVHQRTLKQIGQELGVGEARACQLRGRALEEVRRTARDTILPAA
jgi:RNA polymerase sigma factor for flagellar operon FliA